MNPMSDPKDDPWLPTQAIVDQFLLHSSMLKSLATEVRELSKKKQQDSLNVTKVRLINRVLEPLKTEILMKLPSSAFLDILDEDLLPSNSDAVLVISQYEAALAEFRSEFYRKEAIGYEYYWATVEHEAEQ